VDDISVVPDPLPEPTDQLLTVTEMAARLRIGRSTLDRLVLARTVPHIRIGKRVFFTPEHVAEIKTIFEVRPLIRPQRKMRAS
jgi:excisionase family DNA binding protein